MRRAYHVAKADFLQRVRSKRLVVILAVIAYFGYLVNVGQIVIAYPIEQAGASMYVQGTNTAAFIGLKAGMTGALVLMWGGFYMMNSTLERDRRNNVDRLVASTTLTDRTYVFGKWLSNIGLAIVVIVVLGVASIVNHLVHGFGPTDPISIVGPIVLFALPIGAVVGAVALVFESVGPLNGTGGNIAYFFLAVLAIAFAGLAVSDGALPDSLPMWQKAIDPLGQVAVYDLTIDALHTVAPTYADGPPNFGTLNPDRTQTFSYTGTRWPAWIFGQRALLLLPAVVALLLATVSVQQLDTSSGSNRFDWRSRFTAIVPRIGGGDGEDDTPTVETQPIHDLSFTPVRDRGAGSFIHLVVAELRLTVRGRRWWWYAGAALLICYPLGTLLPAGLRPAAPDSVRRVLLPLVFIWPIFLWSDLGSRTVRHRVTDLVYSSGFAVEQLVAEWLSGVVVGVGLSGGLIAMFAATGQLGGLLGIASGALFAPSLAIAVGTWTQSSELFEMLYLLLWYAGPLNGGEPVDFVGATVESVQIGAPVVFIGISILLLAAGVLRRKREIG